MGYEVIANIYPRAGKEDTLRSSLQSLAKAVHADEKGCSRYQVYEQTNQEGEPAQFVVVEEYADKSAFETHLGTPGFQDLGRLIQEQDLCARPPDIKAVEKIGGFLAR